MVLWPRFLDLPERGQNPTCVTNSTEELSDLPHEHEGPGHVGVDRQQLAEQRALAFLHMSRRSLNGFQVIIAQVTPYGFAHLGYKSAFPTLLSLPTTDDDAGTSWSTSAPASPTPSSATSSFPRPRTRHSRRLACYSATLTSARPISTRMVAPQSSQETRKTQSTMYQHMTSTSGTTGELRYSGEQICNKITERV